MKTLQAIKKIDKSKASENVKTALKDIAVEFDEFLEIKKKHKKEGLMTACYKNLGVKFLGMYNIEKLEDLVKKAKENNLLA